MRRFGAVFPESRVLLYYGSAEMSYVSYLMDDERERHPGSVGRPFPGVAVTAESGEFYVETKGLVYGASSPFASGERGVVGPDGYLCFKGRAGDVYNIKGNHVSKEEILSVCRQLSFAEEAELLPFETETGETKAALFLVSRCGSGWDRAGFAETDPGDQTGCLRRQPFLMGKLQAAGPALEPVPAVL